MESLRLTFSICNLEKTTQLKTDTSKFEFFISVFVKIISDISIFVLYPTNFIFSITALAQSFIKRHLISELIFEKSIFESLFFSES